MLELSTEPISLILQFRISWLSHVKSPDLPVTWISLMETCWCPGWHVCNTSSAEQRVTGSQQGWSEMDVFMAEKVWTRVVCVISRMWNQKILYICIILKSIEKHLYWCECRYHRDTAHCRYLQMVFMLRAIRSIFGLSLKAEVSWQVNTSKQQLNVLRCLLIVYCVYS